MELISSSLRLEAFKDVFMFAEYRLRIHRKFHINCEYDFLHERFVEVLGSPLSFNQKGNAEGGWMHSAMLTVTFAGQNGEDGGGMGTFALSTFCSQLPIQYPDAFGKHDQTEADVTKSLPAHDEHLNEQSLSALRALGRALSNFIFRKVTNDDSLYSSAVMELPYATFLFHYLAFGEHAVCSNVTTALEALEELDPTLVKSWRRLMLLSEEGIRQCGLCQDNFVPPSQSKSPDEPLSCHNRESFILSGCQWRLLGQRKRGLEAVRSAFFHVKTQQDNTQSALCRAVAAYGGSDLLDLLCGPTGGATADLVVRCLVEGSGWTPATRHVFDLVRQAVGSYDKDQLTQLLQFTIGSDSISEGSEIKVSAQDLPGADRLPTSSTCTRELFWPVAGISGKAPATSASCQQIRDRLLLAMRSSGDGFHIA